MTRLNYWAAGDAAQQKAEVYQRKHGGRLIVGHVFVPTSDDSGDTYNDAVGVIGTRAKLTESEASTPDDREYEAVWILGRQWWNREVFTFGGAQ